MAKNFCLYAIFVADFTAFTAVLLYLEVCLSYFDTHEFNWRQKFDPQCLGTCVSQINSWNQGLV